MKNFILSKVRRSIPYIKELMPLATSPTGCLFFQQIEFLFEKYPNGFYKFMEPPKTKHDKYRPGYSWVEEMGFSKDAVRTAFVHCGGIAYKSKGDFKKAENPFVGDDGRIYMYCSYYDRDKRLTYYFRNHPLVDAELRRVLEAGTEEPQAQNDDMPEAPDGFSPEIGNPNFLEMENANFQKLGIPISRNRESQFPLLYEINKEINKGDLNSPHSPPSRGKKKRLLKSVLGRYEQKHLVVQGVEYEVFHKENESYILHGRKEIYLPQFMPEVFAELQMEYPKIRVNKDSGNEIQTGPTLAAALLWHRLSIEGHINSDNAHDILDALKRLIPVWEKDNWWYVPDRVSFFSKRKWESAPTGAVSKRNKQQSEIPQAGINKRKASALEFICDDLIETWGFSRLSSDLDAAAEAVLNACMEYIGPFIAGDQPFFNPCYDLAIQMGCLDKVDLGKFSSQPKYNF